MLRRGVSAQVNTGLSVSGRSVRESKDPSICVSPPAAERRFPPAPRELIGGATRRKWSCGAATGSAVPRAGQCGAVPCRASRPLAARWPFPPTMGAAAAAADPIQVAAGPRAVVQGRHGSPVGLQRPPVPPLASFERAGTHLVLMVPRPWFTPPPPAPCNRQSIKCKFRREFSWDDATGCHCSPAAVRPRGTRGSAVPLYGSREPRSLQ